MTDSGRDRGIRLRLAEPVVSKFPDVDIRVVVAAGFSNVAPWPAVDDAFASFTGLDKDATVETLEADPAVAEWFAAYRAFGTNPRRCRPSVYALLRRVLKDGRLPRINPAVDAYNLVSVTNRVPAGAFDLDRLVADVDIRFAEPGDVFVPLGDPAGEEQPSGDEVVYAMGNQVLTRHWNYRDSELTKVDASTHAAVFVIDGVGAGASGRLDAAASQLEQLLRSATDRLRVTRVGKDQPDADLVVPAVGP